MNIRYILLFSMSMICMPAHLESNENRSIQFYLANQPAKLNRSPNQRNWLRLGQLNLATLEGLENIPDKETVQVLSFHDNKLKEIQAAAFKSFPNLQTIALNNNQITKLDPHALEGLHELRLIHFNDNPLKKFDPAILSGLTNLHDLFLNNTQLTELDPFPELPNLTILYLNNNNLTQINPKVFAKLPNLKWLYLSGNPISNTENAPYQEALKKALPNVTIKF